MIFACTHICIHVVKQVLDTGTYIQILFYVCRCGGFFPHSSAYGFASSVPTTDKLRDGFSHALRELLCSIA